MFAQYRKTIVAIVGSLLTWAGTAYVPDGSVDRAEWYALLVALATAAGVYAVTNGPALAAKVRNPAPVRQPIGAMNTWLAEPAPVAAPSAAEPVVNSQMGANEKAEVASAPV